ncbi:MAG: hypothetical protein EOO48_03230 [Flavobacterium sp.]|nr:MAG: hypothetical protein EOO48_03230 [Flavobacterium sp.]
MNTYQKLYSRFEQDFFGCLTTGVLVQSIIGAIAAMYVLMHGTHPAQMVELFFVVACCMLYNGAVLAQQKPKTIFNVLMISLLVNSIMIAINVL